MKRNHIFFLIAAAVFLLAGGVMAGAQNFQGLNTLQNIASEGQSAGKYVINIAFVFCGIACFVLDGQAVYVPAMRKALERILADPRNQESTCNTDIVTTAGCDLIDTSVHGDIGPAEYVHVNPS